MFKGRGLFFGGGVLVLAAAVTAVFLIQPGIVTAKVVSFDESWIRPGVMVGEKDTDYYIDFFVPFLGTESRLFFFNPQVRLDNHDGDEEHIGLGYRGLYFNSRAILGANLYYDTMKSALGNRYDQFGIGVEALSKWVDFRANYYSPTGDNDSLLEDLDLYSFARTSFLVNKGYEEALRGYDVEVGALVPKVSDFVETRVYVGGYGFQSDHFDDVTGFRGRLEIRPIQLVNLNVEYRDDDVRGSETFGGLYIDIPFKGIKERTKFGTGARPLTDRFVEKVVRDRHIVTLVGSEEEETKIADMIYVNADNTSAGSGTYDDPYQDISDVPLSALYEDGAWIYVFSWDDTADVYSNVSLTLEPDMVLWGQGYKDPLSGLGGGPKPILDGGGVADVIILADWNEVMGLKVQNGIYGIYGEDILGTDIHGNTIVSNSSGGIYIDNDFPGDDVAGMTLSYTFTGNRVADNGGVGIGIDNYIYAPTIKNLTITDTFLENILTGNSGAGVMVRNDVEASNSTPASDVLAELANVNIVNDFSGNEINYNPGNGVYIDNALAAEASSSGALVDGSVIARVTDSSITNSFDGNFITDNEGTGVYISGNHIYASTDIYLAGVTGNLAADVTGTEIANTFTGNHISSNWGDGVYLDNAIAAGAGLGASGLGDELDETSGNATLTAADSSITTTFAGNTINDNQGWNAGVWIDSIAGTYFNAYSGSMLGDLTVNSNNLDVTNSFADNDISGNWGAGVCIGCHVEEEPSGLIAYAGLNDMDVEGDVTATLADSSVTNTFTGDTINSNSYDGVRAYPAAMVMIESSEFWVGGNLEGSVTGTTIASNFTDNNISGNGENGVYLDNVLGTRAELEYFYLGDELDETSGNATLTAANSSITNTFTGNTVNDNEWEEGAGVMIDSLAGAYFEAYAGSMLGDLTVNSNNLAVTNSFADNGVSGNWGAGVCIGCHMMDGGPGGLMAYAGLDNVDVEGNVTATLADSSLTNTFTENTINANGYGGVGAYSTAMVMIEGYDYEDYSWWVGGNLEGSVTGTTIASNFTDNNISGNVGDGVYLYDIMGAAANLSDFGLGDEEDETSGNITLTAADSSITDTFTGNTINDNQGENAGVFINSLAGTYFNAYSGLMLGDVTITSDNLDVTNAFTDNDISGNWGAGVCIGCHVGESPTGLMAYAWLYDMNVEGDVTATLADSSFTTTFTENTIDSNSDAGVWGYPTATTRIEYSGWVGGDLAGSVTGTTITTDFTDKEISLNGGPGIYLDNTMGTDLYVEAEIDGGVTTSVTGSAIETTLTDNDISGNEGEGVWIGNEMDAWAGIYYTAVGWEEFGGDDVVTALSTSTITNTLAGNTVSDNGYTGIGITNNLGAESDLTIVTNGNVATTVTDSSVVNTFGTNTVTGNGLSGYGDGIELYNDLYAWSSSYGSIEMNDLTTAVIGSTIANTLTETDASGNQGDGVSIFNDLNTFLGVEYTDYKIRGVVETAISDSAVTNTLAENTAAGNGSEGIEIENNLGTGEAGCYVADSSVDDLIFSITNSTITNDLASNTVTGNGVVAGGPAIALRNNMNLFPYIEETDVKGDYTSTVAGSAITNILTGNTVTDNYSGILVENYIVAYDNLAYYTEVSGDAVCTVTGSDITNDFTSNTVTGNGSTGIYLSNDITAWPWWDYWDEWCEIYDDGTVAVIDSGIADTFTGNTVSDNDGEGVYTESTMEAYYEGYVYVDGDIYEFIVNSAITSTFDNDVFAGNSGSGVYLEYYTYADDDEDVAADVAMESTQVTGNWDYGVYLSYEGGGTFTGDLGGGALGSAGYNSLYGNDVGSGGAEDLYSNTGFEIYAESNWWGQDTGPAMGQIGGDPVDYDPWLTSAPAP